MKTKHVVRWAVVLFGLVLAVRVAGASLGAAGTGAAAKTAAAQSSDDGNELRNTIAAGTGGAVVSILMIGLVVKLIRRRKRSS